MCEKGRGTMPLLTIPPPNKATVRVALGARVVERDGLRCVYCGAAGHVVVLQVDHVTPCAHFSEGAPAAVVNAPTNLVAACEACNGAKGPQDLAGFARMLRGRGAPAGDVAAMLARVRAATRRRLPPPPFP